MESRVRRASAADLRRMANWMVQGGGARDPQEKALLARIRGELSRRHGVKLPGQAAMTANARLTAEQEWDRAWGQYVDALRSFREAQTRNQKRAARLRLGKIRRQFDRLGASAMFHMPNRRFRRNGYRVVGAGGMKVPQVFGAHHQAVAYGDKAFGARQYVVEFVFNANRRRAA
jgi:hypothetical protein